MDRPWLASYPASVPADIDTTQCTSLVEILENSCAQHASESAYRSFGRRLTFAELDHLSLGFAAYLQTETGLRPGDRLAIMLPNLLQYPVSLFGALRAGLVVVNVNPLYTPRELKHQLADSGARGIVILENFAHTLEAALDGTPVEFAIVTQLGDLLGGLKGRLTNFAVKYVKRMVPRWSLPNTVGFTEVLSRGAGISLNKPALGPNDLAFLQYTGGTTGLAKGAELTHGNMVANVLQACAWLSAIRTPGPNLVVTALPLYHIFSLTANCLTFMRFGGENLLIVNPRDLDRFVAEIRSVGFTAITGVNTLFNKLLHHPGFAKVDFSRLRLTMGGGMAVQHSVAERWKAVTGSTLIQAYGLTETSPAACINPLDAQEFDGSIGIPISSTLVSIRDDDFQALPAGQIGEICVKGPQVMHGYWGRPEETAKVLSDDGWLRTGDIGLMNEDGFVTVVDRKKDMIIVSGFNVYPNEVEDVIATHPGVLEVAAVGIPDANTGESVKAVVVRKDPEISSEEILRHCREYLTAYKIPRQVEFRDELPKSNVGKILRRELREPSPSAR